MTAFGSASMPRGLAAPGLLLGLALGPLFGLTACDDDYDPSGTYPGTATVTSQLSFPSDEPGTRRMVSSSTGVSGPVQVRRVAEGRLGLTLTNGCAIELDRSAPHRASVAASPPQRCVLREGDYEGAFELSGDASFDEAGTITLTLTGQIPQPSEAAGSWSYEFSGQR